MYTSKSKNYRMMMGLEVYDDRTYFKLYLDSYL